LEPIVVAVVAAARADSQVPMADDNGLCIAAQSMQAHLHGHRFSRDTFRQKRRSGHF
jgi:hypothetical protein